MEGLLTAQDVKKALQCSLPHVYNLADRGQIPCVRFPSPSKGKPKDMVRFKVEDVRAFIDAHYVSLRSQSQSQAQGNCKILRL